MTGRPGYRTMEMNGGSSPPYLACTPCVPLFCTFFNRGGNRRAFSLPGSGGGSFPLYGGTFARSYSVSRNGPETEPKWSWNGQFSHEIQGFEKKEFLWLEGKFMTSPARENLPQAIFLPRKMLCEGEFAKKWSDFGNSSCQGHEGSQNACSIVFRRPKRTPKPKNSHEQHQRIFWRIRGGYRSLANKTRVLRQSAPESSAESSAKSLSQKFFGVPFLSLTIVFRCSQRGADDPWPISADLLELTM